MGLSVNLSSQVSTFLGKGQLKHTRSSRVISEFNRNYRFMLGFSQVAS